MMVMPALEPEMGSSSEPANEPACARNVGSETEKTVAAGGWICSEKSGQMRQARAFIRSALGETWLATARRRRPAAMANYGVFTRGNRTVSSQRRSGFSMKIPKNAILWSLVGNKKQILDSAFHAAMGRQRLLGELSGSQGQRLGAP